MENKDEVTVSCRAEAPAPRQWLRFALLFAALAVFFAWYEVIQFPRYPIGLLPGVSLYVCLLWLLILWLAPGFPVSREWLSRRVRGPAGACASVGVFLLPYLVYAAGTGDFRWWACARLAAFAALPFGLFAAAPVRRAERMNWQDALVLLWILTPVLLGRIGGIWNVPVNLDFLSRVYLTAVGAWSFLVIRGLSGCGYDFRLRIEPSHKDFLAVEVKGLKERTGSLLMTPKEYDVASTMKDRFFLFVAKNFRESPSYQIFQNPLSGCLDFRRTERVIVQVSWLTTV